MMTRTLIMTTLLASACGDPGGGESPNEVISRIDLTFTPSAGPSLTFQYNDEDGDGGAPGMSQPITLAGGTTYALTVSFLNALEVTPEDITQEVRDEAVQHQVFFTGSAVVGPATMNTVGPLTHSYADTDDNGLPIGLTSTITTRAGTGELVITLRHMPPEEPPQKAADSAMQVSTGGFAAIGGSTDAQVTFPVTVP